MHADVPAVNGSTPANAPEEYPETLYVRIDDTVQGEEEIYAGRIPRDLADGADDEMLIGVYRLEYLAVLTTTATLTPFPAPRNGPRR